MRSLGADLHIRADGCEGYARLLSAPPLLVPGATMALTNDRPHVTGDGRPGNDARAILG